MRQDGRETTAANARAHADVVFDFTGMGGQDLADLALVLTARLHAGPEDRVWVREIPYHTWRVLEALGLDHLFHIYPGPEDELN